jgi:hypothetical protein
MLAKELHLTDREEQILLTHCAVIYSNYPMYNMNWINVTR